MLKAIIGIIQLLAGFLFGAGGTDFHIGLFIVLTTMGIANMCDASFFSQMLKGKKKN